MADINIANAKEKLTARGFLDIAVSPELDLFLEIERLKKEKNAVVLAHYYQDADIQDVADYIGDSLGLAQQAEKTKADLIVFAGVHFMAETARKSNPNTRVVLPDLKAGCTFADQVGNCYIIGTAEVKALSNIICPSTNPENIVERIPREQPFIFVLH